MTLAFTIENAVLLALAQVGMVVMSAAGAMTSRKIVGDAPLPWLTTFFVEYGVLILALPLAWITGALLIRRSARVSDELKNLVFATGILLIIVLAGMGGTAFVQPLIAAHGTTQPVATVDDL